MLDTGYSFRNRNRNWRNWTEGNEGSEVVGGNW